MLKTLPQDFAVNAIQSVAEKAYSLPSLSKEAGQEMRLWDSLSRAYLADLANHNSAHIALWWKASKRISIEQRWQALNENPRVTQYLSDDTIRIRFRNDSHTVIANVFPFLPMSRIWSIVTKYMSLNGSEPHTDSYWLYILKMLPSSKIDELTQQQKKVLLSHTHKTVREFTIRLLAESALRLKNKKLRHRVAP